MFYVYILKCVNNELYVGCTNDLKDRLTRHRMGQVRSTQNKLPVKLSFYIAFTNKFIAFKFEKYLKSGSGRAFIKRHFII